MATVEELEQRLAAVEQELTRLKQIIDPPPVVETPAERGARMLREMRMSQAQSAAAWAAALKEMGIEGEPVSPEKLREMIQAGGINPEDNVFSRGIIEMREE